MSGTFELQEIISMAISSILDGYAQIMVSVIDSAPGDRADYQIDNTLRVERQGERDGGHKLESLALFFFGVIGMTVPHPDCLIAIFQYIKGPCQLLVKL